MGPRLRTRGSVIAAACVMCLSSATVLPDSAGDVVIVSTRDGSADRWAPWPPVQPSVELQDPPVVPPPVVPFEKPIVPVVRTVQIGDLSIPAIVLAAYRAAADGLAVDDPSCGLRWQILAGIGKIESGHAGGGRVTAEGDAVPRILGPVLDGSGPFASIGDHDDGRWDRDSVWDRAVGPMQFIPGTWILFGADGSGDGVADPNNLFDATLSAGRYLCAGAADLTTDAGLVKALLRYNHSAAYVARVLSWIHAYDSGQAVPTDGAGPGEEPAASPSPTGSHTPTPSPTPSWTPSPSPSPTAAATPTPNPTATPTPTPTACPTSTPSPTETPGPTPTPTPTASPSPSPTPTETPSPTPTASPSPTPCSTGGQ